MANAIIKGSETGYRNLPSPLANSTVQSSGASDLEGCSATIIAQRLDPLRFYCWTIRPRGLRKDQVLKLAQNRWIKAHESMLIIGPSGSGKSFIAQAFGLHACRSGFSVQYLRMPALFTLFVQARA